MKPLPSNVESEKIVLGGMLANPRSTPRIQAHLRPADFSWVKHGRICEALFALRDQADPVSVASWLEDHGKLGDADRDYIKNLARDVPYSAGWQYHVAQISETATKRRIILACADGGEKAYHEQSAEVLSALKDSIREIERGQAPDHLSNLELMQGLVEDLEKEALPGIRTGFENIDMHLGRMFAGETIYLAARPSIGKTALASNIADRQEGLVLFFSLEMTAQAIMTRRVAAKTGIYLSRLRSRDLEDRQWRALLDSADSLSNKSPMILDASRYKIVEYLVSKAESVAMDQALSLIVIDHLQKMRTNRKIQSRHHELSYVSERICDLAKDLQIPVIVLSQLNREAEKRQDPRPKLTDLKESGDIEQNADVVLGLYRGEKSSILEIACLKNRDGARGWKTCLHFDLPTQRLVDCDERNLDSSMNDPDCGDVL
jgi:replicative DNA helicase